MSVQALSCAITMRGVSASEKLLLLVLANYADDQMKCWPSHRRLAADACLSERSVLTLLKGLEARRIISREGRKREDGSRSTDTIILHFGGEVISPRGEAASPGVGKPLRGGGEMASPLTTFEPSSEPEETSEAKASSVTRTKSPKPKSSRRCPSDWLPTHADMATAEGEGFTPGEIDRELAKIRDYQFRDGHSDWSAVFRNWIRRAAEIKRPRLVSHNAEPPISAKLAAKQANMARAFRGGQALLDEREPDIPGSGWRG